MTVRALLLLVITVGWWRVPLLAAPLRRDVLPALGVVVTIVLAAALASGPLLDVLDVDTETFRIATGLVVIVVGAARLLGAGTRAEDGEDRVSFVLPVAYPVLIGPETVLVATSVGSDHGVWLALIGAVVGAALALLGARAWWTDRLPRLVSRLAGAVLVVLAVALVFDGLRDI